MKRRPTPAEQHRKEHHEEWKESLRRACFDRARKNRKDLLWKFRRQQQQQQQQQSETTIAEQSTHVSSVSSSVIQDTTHQSSNKNRENVRNLVEQELRQQGVAVVTPGFQRKADQELSSSPCYSWNHDFVSQEPPQHASSPEIPRNWQKQYSTDNAKELMRQDSLDSETTEYVISEEELYDLLQEVEEEMRRSEEELLEEVLEQERQCQEEDIEQQIAQYEQWQASLSAASAASCREEEHVICPLCWEGMLQHSPAENGVIFCPNETCPLKLRQQSSSQLSQYGLSNDCQYGFSLSDLKERLRLAFEGHSMRCNGPLTFELQPTTDFMDATGSNAEGGCHLVAACPQCDVELIIT